jgi:hypothetical protein
MQWRRKKAATPWVRRVAELGMWIAEGGAKLTEESMNSIRVRSLVLLLGMLPAVTLMSTSAAAATSYLCIAPATANVLQSCSPGLGAKPVAPGDVVAVQNGTLPNISYTVATVTLSGGSPNLVMTPPTGPNVTFSLDEPAIPAVTTSAFAALAGLLLLVGLAFIMRSRKAGFRGGAAA